MADLSITAASVLAGAGSSISNGTAGGTVTAGQPVYQDVSDGNQWKAADANASILTAAAIGIALHASLDNQPLQVLTAGPITIGATVAIGTTYVLSSAAGGICPNLDATTGWYKTIIGVATSATVIQVTLNVSGALIP